MMRSPRDQNLISFLVAEVKRLTTDLDEARQVCFNLARLNAELKKNNEPCQTSAQNTLKPSSPS